MAGFEVRIVQDPSNPSKADVIDAFARAYDESVYFLSFKVDGQADRFELRPGKLEYPAHTSDVLVIGGWVMAGDYFEGTYSTSRRQGSFKRFP